MGQMIPISSSFNLPDGRKVTLETGKLASLADGSVVVRIDDTMLFATVVSSKKQRLDKISFRFRLIIRKNLLLLVEFQEISFAEKLKYQIMKCSFLA